MKRKPSILLLLIAVLSFAPAVFAQSMSPSLANLPDADVLIYVSPQRLFKDFMPKVMPPKEAAEFEAALADIKRGAGVDLAAVEYLVFAVRFHKPTADLNFVAPDVMAVVGGDFSAESLFTLAQLALQDKVRVEKQGSRTIAVMKIDELAKEAEKNPLLKPFVEVGAVALTPNSIAIGNVRYINSAIAAADGTGRIKPETLQSLMRDPNVLMAATGAPIVAFARSFGLHGTEAASREGRCDSTFGNFYSSAVISGANFSIRGAMNADNPDTAKIMANLLSSLMKTDISAIPDKTAQAFLQGLKLTAKDNEVMIEAEFPLQMIADIIREQSKPKAEATPTSAPKKPTTKRTTRRRRN